MGRWTILALSLLTASAAHAAAQFDKPLKSEIIGAKTALHCLTFPNFLLKWESAEYGQEIFILRGRGPWKCAATMKGELTFGSWKTAQVKGRYVLLSENPNAKWGMPFKVFDTRIWRYALSDSVLGTFGSVRLENGGLAMEYRRTYHSDCSVFRGTATACWSKLRAETGIADDAWGICRTAYHDAIVRARGEIFDPREEVATLTYEAVVTLGSGAPVFTARPGPIVCAA